MFGVTQWNAVILLYPTDSDKDILEVLNRLDGFDDMVIREEIYTFSHQSFDAKKAIIHRPYKLYFWVVGGLLYVMRYPKDSD
jgi:hypothetical protein